MKPVLNIVISRTQIFRNFIASDNCQMILDLSNEYKINILSPSYLQNFIKQKITTSQVKVLDIDYYSIPEIEKFSRVQVFLLSVLKFITKTRANSYLIHQQKNKKNSIKYFKLFCANFLAYLPYIKKITRGAYYLSVIYSKKIKLKFTSLPNCDLLFLTSLTDMQTETLVGMYYSRLKTKTIGTPRSWDNITSHGCFPWVPDKILSHSDYMTSSLIEIQGIPAKRISLAVAPNYQGAFSPAIVQIDNRVRIGLACMGFTTNPDDLNLLKWFCTELAVRFKDKDFYIYQHPKFLHKIQFDLPSNVFLRVFPYESTTLQNYYYEISKLDILFAGGTSVLLDAAFCNVSTAFINFDCVQQDYWHSALRYADSLPHTADFLEFNQIDFMNSKLEIENTILAQKGNSIKKPVYKSLNYFIVGHSLDYSHYFLRASRELLKNAS
jgi:hypothetical protein